MGEGRRFVSHQTPCNGYIAVKADRFIKVGPDIYRISDFYHQPIVDHHLQPALPRPWCSTYGKRDIFPAILEIDCHNSDKNMLSSAWPLAGMIKFHIDKGNQCKYHRMSIIFHPVNDIIRENTYSSISLL